MQFSVFNFLFKMLLLRVLFVLMCCYCLNIFKLDREDCTVKQDIVLQCKYRGDGLYASEIQWKGIQILTIDRLVRESMVMVSRENLPQLEKILIADTKLNCNRVEAWNAVKVYINGKLCRVRII